MPFELSDARVVCIAMILTTTVVLCPQFATDWNSGLIGADKRV